MSDRAYFVSATDPERPSAGYVLLAGPFASREVAEAAVARVADLAVDLDPRAPWYAYGTCFAAAASRVVFPNVGVPVLGREP